MVEVNGFEGRKQGESLGTSQYMVYVLVSSSTMRKGKIWSVKIASSRVMMQRSRASTIPYPKIYSLCLLPNGLLHPWHVPLEVFLESF